MLNRVKEQIRKEIGSHGYIINKRTDIPEEIVVVLVRNTNEVFDKLNQRYQIIFSKKMDIGYLLLKIDNVKQQENYG